MAEAPSTPRVRAHRQRRRRGVFCVQAPVDKIAALVRMDTCRRLDKRKATDAYSRLEDPGRTERLADDI